MADNIKLELRSPPSISRPAPTSPVNVSFFFSRCSRSHYPYNSNPLKRKEPLGSSENEHKCFSPAPPLPAGVTDTHQGQYEKVRITCEVCGTGVGFRDEDTGGFTLKHWEAHCLTCSMPGQSSSDPVIYTPESTAETLAHPRTKRRRAKRTEEERIDYLSAHPCVAQFEAYRVLCASCDKWIRLRPNSTYSSTPWDADKKSCISKKVKKGISLQRQAAYQKNSTSMLPRHQPTLSQSSYYPSNPPVDSTAQSSTAAVEIPTVAYYAMYDENLNMPTFPFPNANTAQIIIESDLTAVNYHMPVYRVGNSHSFTSTYAYNPALQTIFSSVNNVQFYHPGDPAVESTAQSPTVAVEVPTSTYHVTHEENINRPSLTNAYTAQGISESSLAFPNHLMPLVYKVGNSDTLTDTHNPEFQTLFTSVTNEQSGNPAVGSIVQSPTFAVDVHASANYYLAHDATLRHGGCREHRCEFCGHVFAREDTLK